MLLLLAACTPEPTPRGTPDPSTTLPPVVATGLPSVSSGAPDDAPDDPDAWCPDGQWILTTFTGPTTSGVLLLDRSGTIRWAWVVADPEDRVLRARPATGGGLWIAVGDRVVDNGDRGVILRVDAEGNTLSSTPTRDPHHDFVELPDGRLAWLGYEFSQPANGATLQYLATDRVVATPEGGGEEERLFSTLADWSYQPVMPVPAEGRDGRTLVGFEVWGQGASLGYRPEDDTLFLLWRFQDLLLAFEGDGSGARWAWGSDWGTLAGGPSFEHGHFSDVWDGGILVFDNRRERSEPSRLVEYAFDDVSYAETWSWSDGFHEDGVADVVRAPGCDHVVATWPSRHRIAEIDRDGVEVWAVTVDAEIERVAVLSDLPW